MTYNASDRKQVRQKEKEAALAEKNRLVFTSQIMSDRFGRAWMHTLLMRCHIWATPFAAGQGDLTSFRLGEQNLGLQIFADVMAAAPQEYVLMMQEASQKDAVDERRYSDDRTPGSEHSGSEGDARDVEAGRDHGEYDPYAGDGV